MLNFSKNYGLYIYKVPEKIILFIACRYGNLDIVKEILEKEEINVNIRFEPVDRNYVDSLSYDIVRPYLDICISVINSDPEYMFDDDLYAIDVFYIYGTCPLHIASMSGNIHLIEYLLNKGAYINSNANSDDDAICAAQFSLQIEEHYDIFLYLHKKGAIIQSASEHIFRCWVFLS